MNSSSPNDNKDKSAMAPSSEAQSITTAPPASNPPAATNSDPNAKGDQAAPNGAPSPQQPNYVVGVPPQQVVVPAWSSGLFECFDDLPTFVITAFAPCVTFGQIAEMVDRGQASCSMYALLYALIMYFTGCGCLLSAYFRLKMAHLYTLPDDPLINILVHLICEPCALCQEHRELQAHGFNMQLGVGWRNQTPEIQQTGGVMQPPQVPNGMNR